MSNDTESTTSSHSAGAIAEQMSQLSLAAAAKESSAPQPPFEMPRPLHSTLSDPPSQPSPPATARSKLSQLLTPQQMQQLNNQKVAVARLMKGPPEILVNFVEVR